MANIINYLENLMRNNVGVFTTEKDYSVKNITPYYNRLSLVIGCSRVGVPNLPILIISPENCDEIFGKTDYHLERRGSFFQRTIKDMLTQSPVIAINIRDWDNDLDKYEWINISTSSDNQNSNIRSNSIQDFYNTSDGFWKRSTDDFLDVVKNNIPNWNTNPLNFVNQKDKPCSLLIFKSTLGGFDIPVDIWYNGKYPSYLHPKDYISDYMVQVIAIEGEWNNYEELSNTLEYGKYFDKSGVKVEYLEEFLRIPTVKTIKRWNGSLIPYMLDKYNNDIFIQTIINDDVNETGILCAYNSEIIEDVESKNGLIDLLGDNLTKDKKPQIDFLSYKRYMTDFLILEETLLDSPNNAFGNDTFNFKGRTQIYSEGFVSGVKLKKHIISSTSTVEVRPFDTFDDNESYGVINGVVVPITSDMNDFLALNNILVPNSHRPYLIVLTMNGIEFRLGNLTDIESNLFLPQIDATKEIVLAYYELIQDNNGNYYDKLFPIVLDSVNGYISPFRVSNENISKISFKPTNYNWIQEIYFEDTLSPNPQDYNQQRLYHLWYWLSINIKQNESLVIDSNGDKQVVKWIEQGNDSIGRYIKIAVNDSTSNIYDSSTSGNISYYMKDIELLSKNKKWNYNKPPLSFGTNGIIGYESIITDNYLNGLINSGDPFFWSLSEESNVSFIYDNTINQNIIVLNDGDFNNLYSQRKVVIDGSTYNDGIFNILEMITYKGLPAIVVQESVIFEESVKNINIYDATFPYIINLYNNGYQTAIVEIWDGSPEELYERLIKKKDNNAVWAKTLEIKNVIDANTIVVQWDRYVDKLEKGYFLLSNSKAITDDINEKCRNWTRIIDLQKLNDTDLLIITDSAIKYRMVENVMETDILKPLHEWISTLDFKVLKGFTVRNEVFPDGTEEKLNSIMNLFAKGTKMFEALTNDKLEWRYLIDSFGIGLTTNSKQQLVDLVQKKQFALGLINTPSIKSFKKDGSKYTTNGMFDTVKFLNGGDRKNNIGSAYSLANNASNSVYLAPWVSVFENGRFHIVPPASHVGQLFMAKHNKASGNIWDAVAGIIDSKITTINGLEERFSDDDLNNLNNYGITTLANFQNITFYVFNEKTAYNVNGSVLNFTHNREALIEVELSLYKALAELQWEFIVKNNNKTKIDIENVANDICDFYLQSNAISNYRNEFIIDNELIDAQIGLLNTYIELNGVLQTIILRVSVLPTGGISIGVGLG